MTPEAPRDHKITITYISNAQQTPDLVIPGPKLKTEFLPKEAPTFLKVYRDHLTWIVPLANVRCIEFSL